MTRYELAQGKQPPPVTRTRRVPGQRYKSSTGWHETQREEITFPESSLNHLMIDSKHRLEFDAAYETLRNMEIPTRQFQSEINKLLRRYADQR